jgi:hypothetical protein
MMRGLRSRAAIAMLMPIMCLVMVSAISASDDAGHYAPIQFRIPSQPLAAALQTYSKVTGVQLLYESGAAGDRFSVPVEGEYTRDAALRALLADTDLVIRYTRSNSITLVPASADPDAPPDAVFAGQADLTLWTQTCCGSSGLRTAGCPRHWPATTIASRAERTGECILLMLRYTSELD